ncbi:conserved hypothetical protein [Paraburkholderia tropica]|uniref:hypothetical protein n=1 Tax=Paraburkholderia tropica TaxID=92647 RepID=UPI001CB1B89D|nr:hypothetical protein [Paraburkholderia tropica]CAG9223709.1 conserved hypothetical protein [Paraburkholderia tropica]
MSHTLINPATGLPMNGDDFGGVDVGGSPWGTDIHVHNNPWSLADYGWMGDGF